MNTLDISTEGKGISVRYSNIHRHPTLNTDVACLELNINDFILSLNFSTGEEMIDWCTKHNFTYEDQRTPEEKQQTEERSQA